MSQQFLEDALIALAQTRAEALPTTARAMAQCSLLDWLACGLAGANEPLAHKIRTWAEAEGSTPDVPFFGEGQGSARMAALVNGTISHALDYDDTHFAHIGHLSVGIYPAALAVAQARDLPLSDAMDAFLLGAEGAIRVGLALGADHYNLGFHQTATAGAFGATLAAARLMGLDAGQMRHALGLCATRASGLKSQFGTMGKPYNAGVAASNGVECASLAALGFTSADQGLSDMQGFLATHAAERTSTADPGRFLFEDNLYKFHACCHGAHAMIEALVSGDALDIASVSSVQVKTNPRWLSVCDLKAPRTGLEVKFSYAWLAGMALRGDPTGDPAHYSDALAEDAALKAFAQKVTVIGAPELTDLQADVHVEAGQNTHILRHDLAAPISLDVLQKKLRKKAVEALSEEQATTLWDAPQPWDDVAAKDVSLSL